MSFRVAVVGLGTRGPASLSLGAINALQRVEEVLLFVGSTMREDWARTHLGLSHVTAIDHLYVHDAVDSDNYDRIVERVLEVGRRSGSVAFVNDGHPRFGSTIVSRLEQRARQEGATVQVVEAISSFDAMLNEQAVDPLAHGSVVVDANRLLRYELALDPRMDVFLYHVCSVGTSRVHVGDPRRDNRWDLLGGYLLRTHSSEHPARLLHATTARGPGQTHSATVGTLDVLLEHLGFATTLYLPAAPLDACQQDADFAKLLQQSATA